MNFSLLILLALTLPINAAINYDLLAANGVEYGTEHITSPKPNTVHFLLVDPTQAQIVLTAGKSCGDAIPTSELAQNNNALAAINGGFWDFQAANGYMDRLLKCLSIFGIHTYDAYPVFASKIGDQWYAISKERVEVGAALQGWPVARLGMLGWNDQGEAFIGHCATSFMIYFDGQPYPVNDVNKPKASGAILYTPAFAKKTPQKRGFIDIVVENGTVIAKQPSGKTLIPAHGFIYSTKKKKAVDISVGNAANLNVSFLSPDIEPDAINNMTYLRGTTPVLLLNGEILPALLEAKSEFYRKRHPRTAVGLLPDGRWLLVVVDGRQKHSAGMSLVELAQYFKDRGCVSAINLDGGGSSTIVVDGEIVNSPSGETISIGRGPSMERPVSDAILIMARD